ncbi:MAG: DnaJ domain-containing protein [Eubacteriales bacterium]|nr:DnaJ domain-containing protein [Eubacteriales bacterium]
MDPYKVLGVTPQTSDDDVKRAYRELARKYHPDNYINNPLSDLAEARMKEINEAYDMIMNERAGRPSGASSNGGGQQYGGQQRSYAGPNAGLYSQVRQAINQGNLGLAESLLQRSGARDAEWFYLMGTVYYRKGWYDEASRAYTQACQMDPSNMEYRTALNNLNMSGGYGGYRPMAEANMCDCCMQMAICNCCMQSCCGGGC